MKSSNRKRKPAGKVLDQVLRGWVSESAERTPAPREEVLREVTLDCMVRTATARDDDRSMEVVVATENPVLGRNRNYELVDQVLLISKDNLPRKAESFIDSHNAYTVQRVLGSVREWATEKGDNGVPQLVGRIYFSENDRGKETYRDYRDGHLTDVSIRAYSVAELVRIEAGKSATVKGRKLTASARPIEVFVRWAVYEVSAVVKGADAAAKVRRSAEEERDMNFEQWLRSKGIDPATLDEAQRATKHTEYLAEQEEAQRTAIREELAAEGTQRTAPPATPASPAPLADQAELVRTAVADALKAEREDRETAETARRESVSELCGEDFPEVQRQAVAEGWDVNRTAKALREAVAKRYDSGVGAPAGIVRNKPELSIQRMQDAILVRSSDSEAEAIIREEDADGADERLERANEVRTVSLEEICRASVVLETGNAPRGRDEMLRAAVTTITLPKVLGAVANKSMLRGHKLAAATWRQWCTTGSVKDFKQNTGVRLTEMGDLEEVTQAAGEVGEGNLSEEYEQYTLARYAKKLVLAETHIINDDLGLLTKVPQAMGNKAALLISKLVYTHLLANGTMGDGNALFSTAHSNLVSGAGYKLSVGSAAFREALEYLRKQTDQDGQPIDVEPHACLCCPEDEEYARSFLASIRLAGGNTGGVATANWLGGLGITPVPETRLSNTNYTGYSTTAWYLTGNPANVDTVEVAFLNGRQTPVLQYFNQQQMGIDVIAIGFRVVQDAVAKALDWRGMVKLAGA